MTAIYLIGDVLEPLGTLDDDSVDLVLTSPPFLALRSYLPADHPDKHLEGGSQATPGEYIDWLVDVVEALDRVLAPHGSLCIELGDTYAGSGGGGGDYLPGGLREDQPGFGGSAEAQREGNAAYWRAKNIDRAAWPLSKSLTLIPELFRLTLVYGTNSLTGRQTEPWRLRNVIRWVRPNPPVGALGDKFRPATSDLMVFCKSTKRYFDLDAVRSSLTEPDRKFTHHSNVNPSQGWTPDDEMVGFEQNAAGAPPLDWWNIPTHPYKGAHYATWPPALCVRPIKSMCPEKVCRTCGEPSRRIVGEAAYIGRKGEARDDLGGESWHDHSQDAYRGRTQDTTGCDQNVIRHVETVGWSDCGHDDWRLGHVLDPFAGTGTVLAVATGHGRDATGIDLDERNAELALDRVGPLLLDVVER